MFGVPAKRAPITAGECVKGKNCCSSLRTRRRRTTAQRRCAATAGAYDWPRSAEDGRTRFYCTAALRASRLRIWSPRGVHLTNRHRCPLTHSLESINQLSRAHHPTNDCGVGGLVSRTSTSICNALNLLSSPFRCDTKQRRLKCFDRLFSVAVNVE